MDTVGKRIRQARKNKGFTQTEIRKLTGISSGNLSDIENDKTMPSAGALISLKRELGVSIDWLLTGIDPSTDTEKESVPKSESTIKIDGIEKLSEEEKVIIRKFRSGLKPVFAEDIQQLTGEVGRLNDTELDIILKFRKLSPREQEDVYDNLNWKYDRSIRKRASSTSTNGSNDDCNGNSKVG